MSRSSKSQSSFSGCGVHSIRWNIVTTAVVLLLFVCRTAQSQSTFASITGTVTDSSGAVVPGAKVVAKNVATNVETATTSNEAGNYTVAQLIEGKYSLTATASGFKAFVAQNVVLATRDIRRIDVTLQVGAVETAVEVSAGATLIETETARVGDLKTTDQLQRLPFNTRSTWAFMSLSPGVLQAAGSSTIRYSGSTGNQAHYTIDGVSMSDADSGTQIGPLNNFLEWIQEMKLDIANNTAEFGTLGQMTLISKSGTNDFHASILEYWSTRAFRARNPFALQSPSGTSHWPGFSVGGPVWIPKIYNGKNKTFFFVAREWVAGSQTPTLIQPTVPLPAWRNGDFSALPVTIYDPTNFQPFDGNKIPATRISSVSKTLQDRFYPMPNYGNPAILSASNYRDNLPWPYSQPDWTVRVDQHFSQNDMMFVRYRSDIQTYGSWQGGLPTIGLSKQNRFNRSTGVSYTHVFGPTLLNEARWGNAFDNLPRDMPINGLQTVKELGLVGLAPDLPDIPGLPRISFSGVGLTGISMNTWAPYSFRNHVEEVYDAVSWFHGRHTLKMGANLTKAILNDYAADASLFGNATFSARFTSLGPGGVPVSGQGHPYADFLLGIPTTVQRAFPPEPIKRNHWQYDLFVTDDFKVNSRLTLSLGMRYQVREPWHEGNERLAMFDIDSGQIVVPDNALNQVSPLFPKGYVGVVGAGTVGLPSTLVKADRINFAPRIGVAYRPWGANTVFRTGYGIFYNDSLPRITTGGLPFLLNEPAYTNPTPNPDVIFPRIFPATSVAGPSTVSLPTAMDPSLQLPYSMQWNATIEHQRWSTGFRLSYIGTNMRKGTWSYDVNSPVPDTTPYVDKPRRFQKYPGISYLTNGTTHQYHGFTVDATRRMAKGLLYQFNWVWARDIGTQGSENPYGPRERYLAQDIPTHRVAFSTMYQFPIGRGRKFLGHANRAVDAVIGGWELNVIYNYYSGQFLTPSWTLPDPTGTAYTTSRTAPNVTRRPNVLSDPNLAQDQRTVARWFDTTVFAAPGLGTFGNSGTGIIVGPWVNVWHTGVNKTFTFEKSERLKLRVEMTATNVMNHPNWSNPGTNVSTSASAGVITGVGGVQGSSTGDKPGPRTLRAGFRLEW
jgi:hypothetical protein